MAQTNSYQDFLNLADQYNIDLNDLSSSGIIPLLSDDTSSLEKKINKIIPDAEKQSLLKELQDAIDSGSEQTLKEWILNTAESGDKNIKELIEDKMVKDSNIKIKDVPPILKTTYVDGADLIRPNKLNKFDIGSFFGDIFDFYKKYGAVGSGTPISEEALRNLVNEGKLTGSPEARPSIREDAKKIIDEGKSTKEDSKNNQDNGKTNMSQGGDFSKLVDNKKEKENKKEEKSVLDKILGKSDFLTETGLRMLRGEGLFPAAIEAAKKQKETEKAEGATALQTLLTKAKIADLTRVDDYIERADAYGKIFGEPGSPEYSAAYEKALNKLIEGSSADGDMGSLKDIMGALIFKDQIKAMGGEEAYSKIISDLGIPELSGPSKGETNKTIIEDIN